jgi:NADH-quinone oxidoreductase subunit J
MNTEQLIFYFFSALLLTSALMVVSIQNLVRSIFLFFVSLFSLAALYIFALADFIAITQVVIYVGGVLVLMLFAFMLSNKELLNSLQPIKKSFKFYQLIGIFICLAFLFVLVSLNLQIDFSNLSWIKSSNPIMESDNTTHTIGILSMTRYLLPFEVLSVFLLMALIGAAHLARKGKKT